MIENEGWRIADEVANLLSIDREVCRRAFYKEPEERVHEVLRQILAERDLPEHDPEWMIEGWTLKHAAGVYGEKQRPSSLENIEEIVIRAILRREEASTTLQ